ncbi:MULTISPECIES: hypothetical protein [unclassified Microcoleus]|uniref:hypothetical protein n=1 Tax=unclassified Microcoleus TaxID=2642155 RepID=UPI001D397B5B|nr:MULTISPECIES: hypothetical protein [unclassified Microcoleus]MCC3442609.1 hypothetical protein [Microcoleus sp. PH2017_03_ELD_O_A]MCC3503905.1 hypothetical protein [Microcoleus sp. PH2017_19_SFW_U_A]TAG07208.1 MAG: hypothetical protein EAZ45_02710 [Oscillatoriales cyanobacterium]MCC3412138.1 hypothetical protein [Microcoleus sp. PH2017_02_FOX_O_A]MCC3434780.1 hypothetical protein [Microcoleus sp. PH2017_05_CCC_O_A]
MLSQPVFGDRSLTQAFYQAVIDRFDDPLSLSTQALLRECTLGFAPCPEGVKTFFIIAPSLEAAEQLIGKMDNILERVAELMAGVGQVALCIVPPGSEVEEQVDLQNLEKVPPDCLACKFFTIMCADAASDR